MLYMPTRDVLVNTINIRGLALRHLSPGELIDLAVDARLGLAQLTHLRTKDVCEIFDVTAGAVAAGIRMRAALDDGVRLTISSKSNGNGHNGHANHLIETLKAANPNELAAAFKAVGSNVVWEALVRAL
jgi:hypothetical protein